MIKLIAVLLFAPLLSMGKVFYAGTLPGKSRAKEVKKGDYCLWNNVLQAKYTLLKGHIQKWAFTNRQTAQKYDFDEQHLFFVVLQNGIKLSAADFEIRGEPSLSRSTSANRFSSLSAKEEGREMKIELFNANYAIKIQWKVSLKNNSNYLINQFVISDTSSKIKLISLVNIPKSTSCTASGTTDGSPLIDRENFFAVENPMSRIDTLDNTVCIILDRKAALEQNDHSFICSAVFGVTPKNQLRRGFLYYLERERARPYHPFLHYNSWFDISWNGLRLHETDCLDRIQTWSDSLTVKRGVQIDGYLWDDGWDNTSSLWAFNEYLPEGFSKMYALSERHGASMGAWISPWGGYEQAKQNRLAFGRQHQPPYETNDNGFSLAGQNYYAYFKSLVEGFIEKEHVAIFKFDGIGAGAFATGAGSDYQGDIRALLQLLQEVRKKKPDLYVSLTAGTWASPYFLCYGDNIWHGGGDYDFIGEGNKRQRWLNYRDYATYQNVVSKSSLYPLNAIMIHGVIDAANGWVATNDTTAQDMSDDIWAFFGNGSSLQELYINPHFLSAVQWDILAKAIRWSREHADVLSDVHWVGGSPGLGEVYGFASWNPRHGTLMLRNPTAKLQHYSILLQDVLELPEKFKRKYRLYNVIKEKSEGIFESWLPKEITLQPFEVKVMDVN